MPVLLDWFEHPPLTHLHGAVCVGNFDGVHRGHQSLIRASRIWAERIDGPVIAITFDPPPLQLLQPQSKRTALSRMADRVAWLRDAGADHVAILRTTPELLSLSPEAFFEDVLLRQFQVAAIVEGTNFRFGRSRLGDVALLDRLCRDAGIGFEQVSPTLEGGEPISSSRIRSALSEGNVEAAQMLLGRAYSIVGSVVSGAKRGRTIGVPTANLDGAATMLPKEGVYAGRVVIDGTPWAAAVNLGSNPTFGDQQPKIEAHILDFTGDLYGRELRLEFVQQLRAIRPFSNVEELKEQLSHDIAAARTAVGLNKELG